MERIEQGQAGGLRRQMMEEMEAGRYAAALETLAKLVEEKQVDAETLYQGAYAYFMLGDYERSANFVSNVLAYAPQHVKARILLARICIVEDRVPEALAILDVVLGQKGASEEEQEEIRDIVDYYGRTDGAKVRRDYPCIASFLGLGTADAPVRQSASRQPAQLQIKNLAAEPVSTAAPVGGKGIEEKIREILAQKLSVREKSALLTRFAGGYFIAADYGAAERLLKAALELDTGNEAAMRGMALLAKEKGDLERALQFVECMKETDFVLLDILRR